MREPVVTANWSREGRPRFRGGGQDMCVMGDECCDGSRRNSEPKEAQYFCSYVRVVGPEGNFIGCRSWTSAAIVSVRGEREGW